MSCTRSSTSAMPSLAHVYACTCVPIYLNVRRVLLTSEDSPPSPSSRSFPVRSPDCGRKRAIPSPLPLPVSSSNIAEPDPFPIGTSRPVYPQCKHSRHPAVMELLLDIFVKEKKTTIPPPLSHTISGFRVELQDCRRRTTTETIDVCLVRLG